MASNLNIAFCSFVGSYSPLQIQSIAARSVVQNVSAGVVGTVGYPSGISVTNSSGSHPFLLARYSDGAVYTIPLDFPNVAGTAEFLVPDRGLLGNTSLFDSKAIMDATGASRVMFYAPRIVPMLSLSGDLLVLAPWSGTNNWLNALELRSAGTFLPPAPTVRDWSRTLMPVITISPFVGRDFVVGGGVAPGAENDRDYDETGDGAKPGLGIGGLLLGAAVLYAVTKS